MRLVDTHVHLHFPDFEKDRAEVMERARRAGVELFINVGTDAASSEASRALAEKHDFIFASAGIHPHDAGKADAAAMKAVETLLAHPKVVAIGEIGLDFFRDHSPQDVQKKVFRDFLGLYRKFKKPLIVHCRDAYEALYALLKEEGLAPYRGVMHCYSSDRETMARFLDLGFHISFAGPLTYKKNDALREACRACPADRILLETDAPFLPPQSLRGKRNESAYMAETAQKAAECRGVPPEAVGEQTSANARELFGV